MTSVARAKKKSSPHIACGTPYSSIENNSFTDSFKYHLGSKLTLHVPFSPDEIVDSNLLLYVHMHAPKLLPFWWSDLTTENRKQTTSQLCLIFHQYFQEVILQTIKVHTLVQCTTKNQALFLHVQGSNTSSWQLVFFNYFKSVNTEAWKVNKTKILRRVWQGKDMDLLVGL